MAPQQATYSQSCIMSSPCLTVLRFLLLLQLRSCIHTNRRGAEGGRRGLEADSHVLVLVLADDDDGRYSQWGGSTMAAPSTTHASCVDKYSRRKLGRRGGQPFHSGATTIPFRRRQGKLGRRGAKASLGDKARVSSVSRAGRSEVQISAALGRCHPPLWELPAR